MINGMHKPFEMKVKNYSKLEFQEPKKKKIFKRDSYTRRKIEEFSLRFKNSWLNREIKKTKNFIESIPENFFSGKEKRDAALKLLKETFDLRKETFKRNFTLEGIKENFKLLREKQKERIKKFKEKPDIQKTKPDFHSEISKDLERIKELRRKIYLTKNPFLKIKLKYEKRWLENRKKSLEDFESRKLGISKQLKKKSTHKENEKILKTDKMRKKEKSETISRPKRNSLDYKVNRILRRRLRAVHQYRGALFRGKDVSFMKERKFLPKELQELFDSHQDQRKNVEKETKKKLDSTYQRIQQKLKEKLETFPKSMLDESSTILKACVSFRKLKTFLKNIDSNPFYLRIDPEKRNKFILDLLKITKSNVSNKKHLNYQKKLKSQSNQKIEKFYKSERTLPNPVYRKKPKRMPKEKMKQEKAKIIKKLTSMLKFMDTNGVLGEDPFSNLKSFSKNRFKGYTRSFVNKFYKQERKYAKENNQFGVWVQVLRNSHNQDKKHIHDHLIKAMRLSNDYIYITSPFINCSHEFIIEICEAAKNGKDVRILTSGEDCDVPMSRYASKHMYTLLLESGVKIYEMNGTLHTKTFVVDDLYTMIGTFNLDFLSQKHLLELCCFFLSNSTAKEVRRQFERDLCYCEEIKLKDVKNLSAPLRYLYAISNYLVQIFGLWTARKNK
jgi:hypothetical protein